MQTDSQLIVPASHPSLGRDDVHVWWIHLDGISNDVEKLGALLSFEEQGRAGRFRSPDLSRRFVVARGGLRLLLGRYLSVDPQSVPFAYNSFGKPSLAWTSPDLRFNLSHSHELALVAFTLGREVGVDIERHQPQVAREDIAKRFFAPTEAAYLRHLTGADQIEAFFRCWTRKEAYIKARGDGLFRALNRFSVAFAADAKPAILHADDDPHASTRWSVSNLQVAPGYSAALVAEGAGLELSQWRFGPELRP